MAGCGQMRKGVIECRPINSSPNGGVKASGLLRLNLHRLIGARRGAALLRSDLLVKELLEVLHVGGAGEGLLKRLAAKAKRDVHPFDVLLRLNSM